MYHMHSWLSFVIVYYDFLFTDQRTRFGHQNYESMRKILSRRFTYQIQTLTLNTSAFRLSDAHKTHSVTVSAVSDQCSFLMIQERIKKSFHQVIRRRLSLSECDDHFHFPDSTFESLRDFHHLYLSVWRRLTVTTSNVSVNVDIFINITNCEMD